MPTDRPHFEMSTVLPLLSAMASLRVAAAADAASHHAAAALAGSERQRLNELLAEVGREGLPPKAASLLFELPVSVARAPELTFRCARRPRCKRRRARGPVRPTSG